MSAQKISTYQAGRGHLKSTASRGYPKYLKLVAAGVFSLALGAISTMVAIRFISPEQAASIEISEQSGAAVDVVTRAVPEDLLGIQPAAEVALPTLEVAEQSCFQKLNELTATARYKVAENELPSEDLFWDQARSIARTAQDCDFVTVTVAGHASGNKSEIENLSVSWQQAKSTIAMLSQEGLDVTALQPLGFGSRSITHNAPGAAFISFNMAPGTEAVSN